MNEFLSKRKRLGITAFALSKIIGSNVCSVFNWERGKTRPRYEIMVKRINNLCKLFDKLEKDPDLLDNIL